MTGFIAYLPHSDSALYNVGPLQKELKEKKLEAREIISLSEWGVEKNLRK